MSMMVDELLPCHTQEVIVILLSSSPSCGALSEWQWSHYLARFCCTWSSIYWSGSQYWTLFERG